MGAPTDPDAELMLRVKGGDGSAFEELVGKYKQPVINLMYRMIRDLDEAEDLAQNVFIRVYQSAHRYQISAKFSTWIFTIARHLCLNEIRRRGRHPAESMDALYDEGEEKPARQFRDAQAVSAPQAFLEGELEAKIQEALLDLPGNQRLAIVLCREEELSYEEIAQVLGCSVSATKSLIHRARESLKQKLKPYLHHGDWEEADETLEGKRCS
jgi:RNA polymerase sigma-70 factor, ECF subfamily